MGNNPKEWSLTVEHQLNIITCNGCKRMFALLPLDIEYADNGAKMCDFYFKQGLGGAYFCPFCGRPNPEQS